MLDSTQIAEHLKQLPEWQLTDGGKRIVRRYELKNFHQVMALANAIAWIAHREDHHPELRLSYRACEVEYFTFAIDGLSENDFICAAKVDALVQGQRSYW